MQRSTAVLVTGCSSGIGRATALAFVRAGLPTWASARNPETLAELEAAGCRTVQLDVADEASRVRAVKTVEAEHGAVGVLVNNAGHGGGGPVEEVPLSMIRDMFETNVFGLVRMCQLVLPGMRAQRSGTIVNLGSGAGLATPPTGCPYAMTKYALESFSDALRMEVTPFGIRTVLIEPGAVATRFGANCETHNVGTDGTGPYEVFKRNVDAMAARAHRGNAVKTAEDVANAITKAVAARRPKARYKVGSQARVAPLARFLLGDRLWDAMMRRMVPFPVD
jgi:NAD(P)-dependent dehydrogenase (short-subunit alcohol dehydrogenase family)